MSLLDEIIEHGNRTLINDLAEWQRVTKTGNRITCADGFTVSVIAGGGTYCTPRPGWGFDDAQVPSNYPGPYTEVEVGYPSACPEPWDQWGQYVEDADRPTETVYAYVPVDLVRQLVASHGGEA